jgi:ATP-dependent Clp protease adaptor protein ClpS
MTQTQERERTDRGAGSGLGHPWHVIVLNDNHNTFDGVAAALSAVLPDVSFEQGLAFAHRIHTSGSAVVWSGHREVAEHYWNGLKRRGLTMAPLES